MGWRRPDLTLRANRGGVSRDTAFRYLAHIWVDIIS
jgi:hypothetical protein